MFFSVGRVNLFRQHSDGPVWNATILCIMWTIGGGGKEL